MAEFKVVVADPKSGRAFNVDASGGAAGALVGKKIGEEVDAGPLGLAGYKVRITGGSDRTGTPANSSLPGAGRRKDAVIAQSCSASLDIPLRRGANERPCSGSPVAVCMPARSSKVGRISGGCNRASTVVPPFRPGAATMNGM